MYSCQFLPMNKMLSASRRWLKRNGRRMGKPLVEGSWACPKNPLNVYVITCDLARGYVVSAARSTKLPSTIFQRPTDSFEWYEVPKALAACVSDLPFA